MTELCNWHSQQRVVDVAHYHYALLLNVLNSNRRNG